MLIIQRKNEGGADENVASYYNGEDVYINDLENGNPFVSIGGTSTPYATVYGSSGRYSSNLYYKYGDATYETRGWHDTDDHVAFTYSDSPFFDRGAYYGYTSSLGYKSAVTFYFCNGGDYIEYNSFRLALCIE